MPEIERYDSKTGRLTADGWRMVLAAGGSVLHNGRLYTPGAAIPSDADLAKGNPEREAAARAALQAQLADLQGQLSRLGANRDMVEPVGPAAAGVAHGEHVPGVPPDLVGSVPPTSGPGADPDSGDQNTARARARKTS